MRQPEPALQPRWLRLSAVVALGLLVSIVVWWPMFKNYPQTPIEDGHWFFHQIESARAAIKQYHELPLWNPFDCRGLPLWDHPENITASPLFYLTLPFSSNVFVVVWHLGHVLMGFVGMWLLCRDDFRLSRAATIVAASAWAFGAVHNQYAGEHMAFVSFYDAPLLLFAWRQAERSSKWAVGTGLLLALMVWDGATYPLPLTVVFLGIETLTRCTSKERILRIAKATAIVGLVGISVGAARLLPIQDQFSAHKRVMEPDTDDLARTKTWLDMYFLRSSSWRARVADQQYVFGEYQAYIGYLGFLVFLVGILSAASETTWMLVIMAVLVALMLGHFGKWAPWTILHAHVPPFTSMRVPARFRLLLALPIAAYMGYAIDRFPALLERTIGMPSLARASRVALFGIGMLAVGDSAGLFTEILEFRFMDPAPAAVARAPSFYYGGNLASDYANQPRSNHAWTNCRSSFANSAQANIWTGDVPQAKAADDGATLTSIARTHNTFTLDIDAQRPTRILLNSAYDRGWKATDGAVVAEGQLLALDVGEGHHHVEMRYWPRRLTLGLWLTFFGLAGSLAFLLRKRVVASRASK